MLVCVLCCDIVSCLGVLALHIVQNGRTLRPRLLIISRQTDTDYEIVPWWLLLCRRVRPPELWVHQVQLD